MKRFWIAAFFLLAAPLGAQTVAITGAKAWTLTANAPIENATIVISGSRIVSVTAAGPVPAGARTIAAEGRVVTPGLINAATQIGLSEVGATGQSDDSLAHGPLGAAFDISYGFDPNALTVQQARADGVSRAMVLPGGSGGAPFKGIGLMVRLVEGPDLVERTRAVMVVAINASVADGVGGSRAAGWQLLRNALEEARVYSSRRNAAPRDQLLNHLDAAALGPVVSGKMPLIIEADRESDIRQSLALARDFPVRVVVYGGAEAWRIAELLAAARIPVILDPLADLPMSYDELGARRDNAARLAAAGVAVAFSVSGQGIYRSYDAGPAIREGAGVAVANGLPYRAALEALTLGPARIWGIADRAGTLAPGMDADLVIWDGDPLEPATAPAMVMVAGHEISLVTRQTLLRDRYAPRQ